MYSGISVSCRKSKDFSYIVGPCFSLQIMGTNMNFDNILAQEFFFKRTIYTPSETNAFLFIKETNTALVDLIYSYKAVNLSTVVKVLLCIQLICTC